MYVDNGVSMTKLAEKYRFDVSKLKHKVKAYLLHGETPFTDEQENAFLQEKKNSRLLFCGLNSTLDAFCLVHHCNDWFGPYSFCHSMGRE